MSLKTNGRWPRWFRVAGVGGDTDGVGWSVWLLGEIRAIRVASGFIIDWTSPLSLAIACKFSAKSASKDAFSAAFFCFEASAEFESSSVSWGPLGLDTSATKGWLELKK